MTTPRQPSRSRRRGAKRSALITTRAAGGELAAEAIAKLAKLNDEVTRIAGDVTLPMAAELESLANKIVDFAQHKLEEDTVAATQEMSAAERISIAVGVAAALLLIATCVFFRLHHRPPNERPRHRDEGTCQW